MRYLLIPMLLVVSACAAQPHKHYYPPRTKCPPLSILPNPATDSDKDAWIADTAQKYSVCAKSRRVFVTREQYKTGDYR